ncbi:MAG: hypothetical protein SFV15_19370 [Polyangiaceae bacterium]|nr:hypothetical protein [Polyangiaceae bacterium]
MKLPGAAHAFVADEKVRDYLLSPVNPRARGKAAFFRALGFDDSNWALLREALLEIARSGTAGAGQPSEFGVKYEIRATLNGPTGRQATIKTVWIMNAEDDTPRFVTAYPD